MWKGVSKAECPENALYNTHWQKSIRLPAAQLRKEIQCKKQLAQTRQKPLRQRWSTRASVAKVDNPPSRPCGVEALFLDIQSPEKTLFYQQSGTLHSDAPTSFGYKKNNGFVFSFPFGGEILSRAKRAPLARSLAGLFLSPAQPMGAPHSAAENGQTTVVPPLHKCSVTERKSSDDLQD